MARLPNPGSDQGAWGTILNEYLSQSHNGDGTLKDNTVTAATIVDGSITKTDVGLSNVDNTSDANKPISTTTQTALDTKLTTTSNLSDLTNTATARTNLGLGSAATMTPTTLAADGAFTGLYTQLPDNRLALGSNAGLPLRKALDAGLTCALGV